MNISDGIRNALTEDIVRPKPWEALERLAKVYSKSDSLEEINAGIAIHNLALDLEKTSRYPKLHEKQGRNRSFDDIYRFKYMQEMIHEEVIV